MFVTFPQLLCIQSSWRRRGIWFPKMWKPRPVEHQLPLTPLETATHTYTHTPRQSPARHAAARWPERQPVYLPIFGGAVGQWVTRVYSLGVCILLCLHTYIMDWQKPCEPRGRHFTIISFSVWSCICATATTRASCMYKYFRFAAFLRDRISTTIY